MKTTFRTPRPLLTQSRARAVSSVPVVVKHKRTAVRARVSALARAIRPVVTGEGYTFERCGSWRQLRL
jgi:hypothetical protein